MGSALARAIAAFGQGGLAEEENQRKLRREATQDAERAQGSALDRAIKQFTLDAPQRQAEERVRVQGISSQAAALAERARGGDESAISELEALDPSHPLVQARNVPKPEQRTVVPSGAALVGPNGRIDYDNPDRTTVPAPPQTVSPGQGVRQPDGSYKVLIPAKKTVDRAPLIHDFNEGGKNVTKISHDNGRTWQVAGNTKTSGAGGGAGMSQGVQVRMLGAVSEARAAIPRMEAMEKKWLDNPETVPGWLGGALAKMGTRFSGSHTLSGIGAETVGEQFADPEVLQYMRDAALMARATQLMSSRGGSEAMVNSEQLLNRAVPRTEGLRQSVLAAQKSRNAIFGPMGGLMQALSPEQIAKVEAGLKAIDAGDPNGAAIVGSVMDEARSAGASSVPRETSGGATLSAEDAAHAQRDPAFKKWLEGQGIKVP